MAFNLRFFFYSRILLLLFKGIDKQLLGALYPSTGGNKALVPVRMSIKQEDTYFKTIW